MNRFLAFSVVAFISCLSISYLLKAEAAAYTSEASRPASHVDDCAPATYWAAVTAAAIVAE